MKKIIIILVMLLFTTILPIAGVDIHSDMFLIHSTNTAYADDTSTVDRAIKEIVKEEHVSIIRAMVWVESRGNASAVSATGDYGILQVNKRTWKHKYDFSKMHELYYGLYCGYDIFMYCLDRACGDVRYALRLYNGSWAYVDKIYNTMEREIAFS